MKPTTHYFIRIHENEKELGDILAWFELLPGFKAVHFCDETGKKLFNHHYHFLVIFSEPVSIELDEWRDILNVRAINIQARNPDSKQPIAAYERKVINYIMKDGVYAKLSI